MAKPILLIEIPYKGSERETSEYIGEIYSKVSSKFSDYHVLVYGTTKADVNVRAIFEKDFEDAKFEELKSFIAGISAKPTIDQRLDGKSVSILEKEMSMLQKKLLEWQEKHSDMEWEDFKNLT